MVFGISRIVPAELSKPGELEAASALPAEHNQMT